MAPIRPSARDLRAQRISGALPPLAPTKTFRPSASTSDSFLSSKLDKRIIKRSAFVSRVRSSSAPRAGGVAKKRSRKAKPARPPAAVDALAAGLGGLADALPELGADGGGRADGKVQHRSLRSKPGALRRKERIVRGEMERFGASMASLATVAETASAAAPAPAPAHEEQGRADKWAALRGFIASSMKQNPAFEK